MRNLDLAVFISLDGVMQAPGGPGEDPDNGFEHEGWSVTYWEQAMMEKMGAKMSAPFDLVLGRRTYDIFAGHWPRMPEDPMGRKINAATKYVATHDPATLTWGPAEALGPDPVARLAELRKEDGPPLLVQGSSTLTRAILAAGIWDSMQVWTFPVLLGHGKRFFGEAAAPGALKLVDSATSATGVQMNRYEPAGPVPVGSFMLEEETAP
ncbi:MAG: dihydrofolate reductase family protein [Pseudooceanicola sp.]